MRDFFCGYRASSKPVIKKKFTFGNAGSSVCTNRNYNGDGYFRGRKQQRIFTVIIVSLPRTSQLKWDRENNPGRRGETAAMQFIFTLSEQSRYAARNSPLYHSCARVA